MIYWDGGEELHRELVEKLILKGLKHLDVPKLWEISISIVDKAEIQEINKEYRDKNEPTDVLSFPLSNPDEWEDNGIPIALGDIIICTEIAQEQADEYGHSFERELGFLAIHGLLHLAGYDHMNPEEEAEMRQAQRDILGELI